LTIYILPAEHNGLIIARIQELANAVQVDNDRVFCLDAISNAIGRNLRYLGDSSQTLSYRESLCPALKAYLPVWRTLFGLGLQAKSSPHGPTIVFNHLAKHLKNLPVILHL
jgi:hypothetical protein